MALISMKQESDEHEVMGDNPYGYGLQISLSDEQCKALGITVPPAAGTALMMQAKVIVASVTQEVEPGEGETEVYMRLQITDMELGAGVTRTDAASMLYS